MTDSDGGLSKHMIKKEKYSENHGHSTYSQFTLIVRERENGRRMEGKR